MGRTPFYRTSIELEHFFSNIEWTRTCSFVGDRTRTSNFEPNRAFTTLTKSHIELTRTSFFRTSIELEHVHLMVIEHPIFGFKRSNTVRPITTTLCSNWTLSKVNGCGTKTVHIWPYVDKAKMCLRGSSFFQFFKTFAFSVVCLHFFQWNTTSQMHFGFTNMGSNMQHFSVRVIFFW